MLMYRLSEDGEVPPKCADVRYTERLIVMYVGCAHVCFMKEIFSHNVRNK